MKRGGRYWPRPAAERMIVREIQVQVDDAKQREVARALAPA